jgi:Protein of unknown function DUF262
MEHPFDIAEAQIRDRKKQVDFDIKEFSIEKLVHKFKKNHICTPNDRKELNWSAEKQAKFIESVILGIPIAPLFVVDVAQSGDKGGKWEIIDGVQRIQTLTRFLDNQLILNGLELLTMLNGKSFADMSTPRRQRFMDTLLKFIVFSKKSEPSIRLELFQRINVGRSI